MSATRKQLAQRKTLDSFCKSESILQTKIALMTFYNTKYSEWTEKIILLIEYLQLISQTLIFHAITSSDTSSLNPALSNLVLYFFKLVNPSQLMPLEVHDSLSSTIFIFVLSSAILKYLLFLYVVIIAYRNYEGNSLLLALWKWIFKTQNRILCILITSFWTAIIIGCSNDSFQITGVSNTAIIGICCLLMLIEYLFSFYIEIHFDYVLPTKNFLAAKSCTTQTFNLAHKIALQISSIAFQSNFEVGSWVFSSLNIIFTVIKTYRCYDKMPLYYIKAFLTQNKLHSLVLSLNLACFIHTLLYTVHYENTDTAFIIIVWFLLAILIVRVSNEIFIMRIANMISLKPTESTPELLVHKISAVQELRRCLAIPGKKTKKSDLSYLLSASESVNRDYIFGIDTENLAELGDTDGIFVHYLTNLAAKFPTNSLVKLHLALACIKKANLYVKSLRTTAELVQNRWSRSYLSASLLINEAEKAIASKYHSTEDDSLDLLAFMKSKMFGLDLQAKILEQAELNIKICNNILGDTAHIGQIFNYAQEVDKCRHQVQKRINRMTDCIPDNYVEVFLLVAGYNLVLEYSEENFEKYMDMYIQKRLKYTKYFENPTLTKENLYQLNNIFLMLSGEKSSFGQIVYCSRAIQSVCGSRAESYRGAHISTLFTPSFQPYYYDVFKQIFAGELTLPDKIQRGFLYNKDGYIIEVEFYFKIHPYLTQGLYLSMIIRPTNAFKEYLLVKEDGSIEGTTQGIADTLGLYKSGQSSSTFHNVKVYSEQLWKVNQAINIVARSLSRLTTIPEQDQSSKGYKKAFKLYKSYTSGNKKIGLVPAGFALGTRTEIEKGYYYCNVSLLPCGSTTIKVIELVKLNGEDGIRSDDSIDRSFEDDRRRERISAKLKTVGNIIEESRREYDDDRSQSEDIRCEENVKSDEMVTEWRQTELNIWTGLSSPSPSGQRLLSSSPEKRFGTMAGGNFMNQLQRSHTMDKQRKAEAHANENQLEFVSNNEVNFSNSKAANTAFRNAIAINFRPRSFRAICLMFYSVIFITFLSQVLLKIVSDSTMEDLSVKKDLMSLSQLRTYKMLFIVINARRAVNNLLVPDLGTLNGQTFAGFSAIVTNLLPHRADIRRFNKQMIQNMYPLSGDIKQNLFSKDIRVYGSYVDSDTRAYYKDVTNFEVIDAVVDAIDKLEGLKRYPQRLEGTEGYNLYNFLLLNVLNDYLYKSQEITDLFINSVNKERDYFQLTINLCLMVTPLLLVGIVIMLIVIIWRHYNKEKKLMLAFIRLKPKAIKDVLRRLVTFKKKLADRDPTKLREWLESIKDLTTMMHTEQQKESNYHKKHDAQVIKYSETRVRYFGYVLKVGLYILILIGVMLWSFFSAQNSANVIYRRQSQLELAYHLSEVSSITYCALNEIFGTNNKQEVQHKSPKTVVLNALAELKSIQNRIPEAFQEDDGTYDPIIEGMIFSYKTCEPYNFVTTQLSYCIFMISHGANINLLSLISTGRDAAQSKVYDYDSCDKSNLKSLLVCGYTNVDYLMPSFALSAVEAQKIGDIVAANLKSSIDDAYAQRKAFLVVFSASLAIASLLIWVQVLRKVRDIHNDFKKVLQIFPPQMILSSFVLKNFLIKRKNFE